MIRIVLVALTIAFSAVAAQAGATRIKAPDGSVIDVITTASASVVTSYTPQGKMSSRLRYPTYKGDDGHERLILLLSPPGSTHERQQ
ncbi:hypothetical protein RDV64_08215 [Acuticoccus sp. MNP-M23]|uniref:hypothetical protein n=1 Tax=Acuticoccus sp. MNP-M23 TaxID=3072793 RepID=UPI0028154C4B|nr:hypothetical protein [Acuticoccus sp. MNP-M23]WMS44361.1 hypothetical protein RDV64_08215 [Acuticoccus sp. MNP-M23]